MMRIKPKDDGCIFECDTDYLLARVVNGVVEVWEPRTPPQPTETPSKPSSLRPGDVLSYAIQAVTGKPAATCGPCAAHVRELNKRGWLWMIANRATVAQWLAEGAKRRGHVIDKGSALELLAVAVREIKQRRNGDGSGGQTS